jgi:hypothetical protein
MQDPAFDHASPRSPTLNQGLSARTLVGRSGRGLRRDNQLLDPSQRGAELNPRPLARLPMSSKQEGAGRLHEARSTRSEVAGFERCDDRGGLVVRSGSLARPGQCPWSSRPMSGDRSSGPGGVRLARVGANLYRARYVRRGAPDGASATAGLGRVRRWIRLRDERAPRLGSGRSASVLRRMGTEAVRRPAPQALSYYSQAPATRRVGGRHRRHET